LNIQEQISRNALVWIIICMFSLVAPHVVRLPIWVLVVYVIAAIWRTMVYTGRWSFPGRLVKLPMTLSCFVGIYLSFGTFVSLEATVALLLAAFALKLIELVRRKDAYVLLFLGYFVCITEFLFSQDILITLLTFFNVFLVTTALVALHQPGIHTFNRSALRTSGVMLLQALPLMVVLFFLFPRFGPLWSVPIKSGLAKTGMSDFMRPGDVARLSQSDEVAFRVQFEGDIPSQSDLYWRGLVFSRLKEGTWSALNHFEVPVESRKPVAVNPEGDPLEYSVIMEPSRQNWLYGLHYARSSHGGVLHAADYRMFSPVPIEAEFLYKIRSWPGQEVEPELGDWRRKIETRLPPKGDEKTRALARSMREEAGSDEQFIQDVLRKFNTEPYSYTLQPGTLPRLNGMDQFMFETRRGFCEHYSYAFVLMMRAAGIPSRVVAGYQGGEINPVNKTVIVHQFDAHAWTEVWLEGEGWRRVDPTAAVSPLRIESGLEMAMQEEGSFLSEAPLSPLRYRNIPLINQLRLRYDALTYRWQSWVVGFDNERQFELLHNAFGEISARVFVTVFLGSWAFVLIPVAIALLRRPGIKSLHPVDKAYLDFCDRLAKVGITREHGETPGQLALRVRQSKPNISAEVDQITQLFSQLMYAPAAASPADSREQFIRLARKFQPNQRRGAGEIDENYA
jgi:protein-glutamine gamma-glutamyltransferase